MATKPLIYQFLDVRVEVASFRVSKAGRPIALEPKAIETLIFLLERRGRLVERDELLNGVWQDSFVTPNSLTRIIAQLRRELDDDPKAARVIETVPTRGYRFIAEVEQGGEAEPPGKSAKSIAVLPFKQLQTSNGPEYLSLGLADAVITRLSISRQITVRPTCAVLKYSQNNEDVVAIARELKVGLVLDGAVQQSGARVRMTARLVCAADGVSMWADSYDAEFKDVFQVQDAISMKIAGALSVQLTKSEQERMAKRPTEDVEAYHLYLRGNYYLNNYTTEDHDRAIGYFNQAIARDPSFALAYAGLCHVYAVGLSRETSDPRESSAKASAVIQRAFALDPDLAEAHASMAAYQFWNLHNVRIARKHYIRAIELNPNSAVAYHQFAWFYTATGRFEEAKESMRRALEIDPLSPAISADQGLPFYYARDYESAYTFAERARALDANNWWVHWRLGEAYEGLGDYAKAAAEFEHGLVLQGMNELRALLARARALAGKSEEARCMLNEITDEITTPKASRPSSCYYAALAYLALGEEEVAWTWLDRAQAENEKWLVWAKVDPRLDPIRGDTRFVELTKALGVDKWN